MPNKHTTIWISLTNKERLSDFGKAGDSMDTAIGRVLDLADAMRDEQA